MDAAQGASGRCIICHVPNAHVQMGIDMCRACKVFYRRGKSKIYACASGTHQCTIQRGKQWPCKSCRLNKIRNLLSESMTICAAPATPGVSNYAKMQSKNEIHDLGAVGPILERLNACYNDLCRRRYTMELQSWGIPDDEMVAMSATIPSAYKTLEILHSVFPSFAGSVFEEFNKISSSDQKIMAQHFTDTFKTFDDFYRTLKWYPDSRSAWVGLTRYVVWNAVEDVFACAGSNQFLDDAISYTRIEVDHVKKVVLAGMQRLALTDVEFLACAGILLWDITDKPISEELYDVAVRQKNKIVSELCMHYKQQSDSADHTSRLGEILAFFSVINMNTVKCEEIFGVLKMLDIIDEASTPLFFCQYQRIDAF